LEDWILEFSAIRISDSEWPTAPGQGAISVHCRTEEYEKLTEIREILNHKETESDVNMEREILQSIGGGCLYPAGIKVRGGYANVQISPMNWKEIFSRGLPFPSSIYHGNLSEFESDLPNTEILDNPPKNNGPKLVSTLNSDRLATILQNDGINVVNKPVIELISKPENWPKSFIDNNSSRSDWPYLVLTSPFAAKCAIEVSKVNPDLNRIQWLAIGEGTARACFLRGVTVSICAKARDSNELIDYIDKNIDRKTRLMIPRSNVSNRNLSESLEELGFSADSWVGYENRSKSVPSFDIQADDVLLLSSPSSARAWVENSLPIPKSILCMGKSSLEEIDSLGHFSESTVEILKGPTAEFVSKWWKTKRGG
jgi:uroporphyrinogen-III synthase